MRFFAKVVLLALAPAVSLLASRVGHAAQVEVAWLGGYATNPGSGQPNPLGFGLGGHAGLSVAPVYFGARFEYFLGESRSFPACNFCGTGPFTLSLHSTRVGGELGYEFPIGPVILRPQVGLGGYVEGGSGNSPGYFYVEPGAAALARLGPVIAGLEGGAFILPGYTPFTIGDVVSTTPAVACAIDLVVGTRF